ncbi:hypothetical protein PWEIH_07681 [Listeria weihenstephanensis FSL R9-0317]|uniref:Uncharacterized protein n=1 Tax=Listeria weihenstephanensis TaxID=1006155 RepID=A0A1S7FVQ5_9LIST|nr:hypothetical protein [Listeria weihenstephanensis]AQY51528.1 hypothetical protein UE46_11110 [Listeria weihenstephanensis]EUJ39285.1 hypothetical protein PWEIH_07681 [Listeria weihenstephanensis FSL R9-0317]
MGQGILDIDMEAIVGKFNDMKARVDNFTNEEKILNRHLANYYDKIDEKDKSAIGYNDFKNLVYRSSYKCEYDVAYELNKLVATDESNKVLATYYATGETFNQLFANYFDGANPTSKEYQENVQFAAMASLGIGVDLATGTFKVLKEGNSWLGRGNKLWTALTDQLDKGVKFGSSQGKITLFGTNDFIKANYGGNVRWMNKSTFLNYNLTKGLTNANEKITFKSGGVLSKAVLIGSVAMVGWNNYQTYASTGDRDRAFTDTVVDLTSIGAGIYAGEVAGAGATGLTVFIATSAGVTCPPLLVAGVVVLVGIGVGFAVSWTFNQIKGPVHDGFESIGDKINSLKDWNVGY